MNKQFTTFIIFIFLMTSWSIGQVISKPELRSEVLGGMQETLGNIDRPAGEFSSVNSPFNAKIPKKSEPVIKDLDDAPKVVVGEVLPDDQALEIISKQFAPLGSLVVGDRGVLQLPGNRTIEKGATFKAEIKGNIYEIKILDVTSSGYTLQLGTAEIKRNFLTTSGTAE